MADTVKRTSTPQPGIVADFYAPSFEIEVEGQELGETLDDVLEVKVDMDFGRPAHFELSLDNWDDRRADFKHSGSARNKIPPLFDLGHRVVIRMGYAGQLFPMFHGRVTSLSVEFPESGPRTLRVSGLDGMFELMGSRRTISYQRKADWQIAEEIANRHVFLRTRVTKEGPKHKDVTQKAEDDATFLNTRAQRLGFDFYFRTDPATGGETLVFVKSESRDTSQAPVYVFEWGKSLLHFNAKLDISEQVGEVTVRNSNPDDKHRPFEFRATAAALPSGPGRNGPAVIEEVRQRAREDSKHLLVENEKVTSQEEARLLAISLLRERAYKYSTGSGKVIGFPKLRPGDNVQIEGVGPRFGGCYQVSHVEHTINSSGYLTSFDVRRVHDGGPKPEPAPKLKPQPKPKRKRGSKP